MIGGCPAAWGEARTWRVTFRESARLPVLEAYLTDERGVLPWSEGPERDGLCLRCTATTSPDARDARRTVRRTWQVGGAFAAGARVVTIALPEAITAPGSPIEVRVDAETAGVARPVLSAVGSIAASAGAGHDAEVTTLRVVALSDPLREVLIAEASSRVGLAGSVWDCALVLARYLDAAPARVRGRRCLDLGCGAGLVGVCTATLGGRAVLCDRPEHATFVRDNLARNAPLTEGRARFVGHRWGADPAELSPPFEIVLLSDVTYGVRETVELCETLVRVCHPSTEVLLAHRTREAGDPGIFEALDRGFVRRVITEARGDLCGDVRLFELRPRSA